MSNDRNRRIPAAKFLTRVRDDDAADDPFDVSDADTVLACLDEEEPPRDKPARAVFHGQEHQRKVRSAACPGPPRAERRGRPRSRRNYRDSARSRAGN